MAHPKHQERRRYERRQVSRTAVLSVDGHQAILETRDLSLGGAFLQRGDSPLPPEGSEVYVDIAPTDADEEPMVVRAQVVRVTDDGIGIVFLE